MHNHRMDDAKHGPTHYVSATYYTAGDSSRRTRAVPADLDTPPEEVAATLAAALDRDPATVTVAEIDKHEPATYLARARDLWLCAQDLEAGLRSEVRAQVVEAITRGWLTQTEAHEITGISRTTLSAWLQASDDH